MQEQIFISVDFDEFESFLRKILSEELRKILAEKTKKSRLLTLAETCDLLRISRSTLSSWIKKGILTPTRFGRRVFFDEKKLFDDIEAARNGGKISF